MRSLSLTVKPRRTGRPENSGDAGAGAASTVGLRPSVGAAPAPASISRGSMGMSETILPRLQGLNSRGVNVSLLLARRVNRVLSAGVSPRRWPQPGFQTQRPDSGELP